MADTPTTTVPLDIPGARGTVALKGADGIFYSVLIDGEPVKRRKGGWAIPMRKGDTSKLEVRGILSGFQTLVMDGREVHRMGGHASTVEKALMFLPLILVVFGFLGAVLAVLLFFMNVLAVKNPLLPRVARIAIPIVNTIAGGVILFVLANMGG
ncbi:hypothetical protein [Demequina activiva]|uniref:Uncharacterized protein n=1 Tax=Demequina activiva TaxID=1582364 RepID=A0A919UG05_9MICO|nr:hypothetical protein [Demequina activiva]GIG54327.1 hypothetical protein Dac01nite_10790 [Demequina activiva]